MANLNSHGAGSRPDSVRRAGLAVLAWLPAIFLTGCLYTTQHFNTGRLLEPGETAVTLGMGKAHFYREECPEGFYPTYVGLAGGSEEPGNGEAGSGGERTGCRSRDYYDLVQSGQVLAVSDTLRPIGRVREDFPKASLGYRLGVRKQWGPLTGIEIGWTVEGPTNPASLEFDLKAGLPLPSRWKASHSLSVGWGVGAWVDNTWFAEYAASRAFGRCALFAGYRYSYLATQPENLDSSARAGRLLRFPHFAHQFALGWYQRIPALPVIPDYAIPAFTMTLPVYRGDLRSVRPPAFDLNFNLGVGWDF